MENKETDFLRLKRSIYGLGQSARESYKTLVEVLKNGGFIENKANPCLLSKWDEDGIVFIGVNVDDCLVIGKEDQISKLITDLKTGGFSLKVTKQLTNYLSCRVWKMSQETRC
jgi:Reverse transcriptase (RNA-dependent DNA polymerase)